MARTNTNGVGIFQTFWRKVTYSITLVLFHINLDGIIKLFISFEHPNLIGIMPYFKGLTCPRCGRRGLMSEAGLNRHMSTNTTCRALLIISSCNKQQNVDGTIPPVVATTDPAVETYSTINLAIDNSNSTVPHNTMVLPSNLSDLDEDDALELDQDSDLVVAPVLPAASNTFQLDKY